MYHRYLNCGSNLWGDLVNRIRANQDEIRAGCLKALSGFSQYLAAPRPLAAGLILLDFSELHTIQNDFRRMQSAQLVLHFLVDDLVVMNGTLPAHSAKQSDCFHVVPPFANNLSDTKRGIERDNLSVVLKPKVFSGEPGSVK